MKRKRIKNFEIAARFYTAAKLLEEKKRDEKMYPPPPAGDLMRVHEVMKRLIETNLI